ncbi:MAG: hypothetical protein J6Z79_06120, partial [Clostridia bacterium]|nr:hypothetical protein [Clostridia bacterium]
MILILAACLCLGYYLACGIRFSFRTSLLWGWLAAAAYFSLLFCLPARARHWGLTPFVLYLVFLALFLRKSAGADAPLPADAILVPGSRADGGMPPRFLESRAEAARALWEKKPVPVTL